ncbi:MAG: hypothetical protein RIC36_03635 [Rhodospirillales bacterium]
MIVRALSVLVSCIGLMACAVIPQAPEIALQDLRLRLADGELVPVNGVFEAVSSKLLAGRPTPEGIIARKDLGPVLDWLASHDANNDGYLHTGELNAAWILLAAWAVTGRPYEASRLTDSAGMTVGALSLSADDRIRLDRIIGSDPATARLLSEARLRLALAKDNRMSTQSLFIGPWF